MCCTYPRCLSRSSDFLMLATRRIRRFSKMALHAVPPAVMAVGAFLGGVYAFLKRRASALAG